MHESFKVLGLTYLQCPMETRELVSLTDEENRAFLRTLKEIVGVEEALIISTCNRTEIYYSAKESKKSEIISLLLLQKGQSSNQAMKEYFWEKASDQAVEHLYEVALGLDAQVLGDIQISNQVKRAYQACADEQMAGPFLHRLMHAIFYANKRVTQETAFRDGAASTAYASVELTEQFISNFKEPKVLVLGLGEIGSDVAGNLIEADATITLANRTLSKAEELSNLYQYKYVSYKEALSSLDEFDVIISSVAVDAPIITEASFKKSHLALKLIIDLSVPRSIDTSIESIPGMLLYNVDQLEQKTSEVRHKRESSIPQVRSIMTESIAELENWAQEMEVSPTIKKLKQALEDIRQEELSRYLRNADEAQRAIVEQVTKSMLQKVIKLPVLQLKAACKRGEAETLTEVLNDLFNLEKDVKPSSKTTS
jgi:glutamyl-tRNA reductase